MAYPYASVAEFKARYGTDRLKAAFSGLTDPEVDEALLAMLVSASSTMDSHFITGGYNAPIDTSGLATTPIDIKSSLETHLSYICLSVATELMNLSTRSVGPGAKSAKNQAYLWLEKVADCRLVIPNIPKARGTRIRAVGSDTPAMPTNLFNRIFRWRSC